MTQLESIHHLIQSQTETSIEISTAGNSLKTGVSTRREVPAEVTTPRKVPAVQEKPIFSPVLVLSFIVMLLLSLQCVVQCLLALGAVPLPDGIPVE